MSNTVLSKDDKEAFVQIVQKTRQHNMVVTNDQFIFIAKDDFGCSAARAKRLLKAYSVEKAKTYLRTYAERQEAYFEQVEPIRENIRKLQEEADAYRDKLDELSKAHRNLELPGDKTERILYEEVLGKE